MKSLLDFPRQTFLFPIAFVIFMILPAYDFPIWFFLRLSYDLWPPVSRVSENLFCPSVYSSKVRTNKTSMRMMVIGNDIIFARFCSVPGLFDTSPRDFDPCPPPKEICLLPRPEAK